MKYSSVIRKVGAVLLGALILFYAIYHVCVSVYVAVETETAVLSTLSDLYETEAYVIRNEKVITADTNGQVVDYAVEEGGKVSKGGTVANLYSSGDSITRRSHGLEPSDFGSADRTARSYNGRRFFQRKRTTREFAFPIESAGAGYPGYV